MESFFLWSFIGLVWIGGCFCAFELIKKRMGKNTRNIFGFSNIDELMPVPYRTKNPVTFRGNLYCTFVVVIKLLWSLIVTSGILAIILAIVFFLTIIAIIIAAIIILILINEEKQEAVEDAARQNTNAEAQQLRAFAQAEAQYGPQQTTKFPPPTNSPSRSSDWTSSPSYVSPASNSSASDSTPHHSSDDDDDNDKWRRTLGITKCDDCNDSINDLHHGDIGDGKCAECQGNGHPPFMPDDDCYKCGGSGDCPSCNGQGFTED